MARGFEEGWQAQTSSSLLLLIAFDLDRRLGVGPRITGQSHPSLFIALVLNIILFCGKIYFSLKLIEIYARNSPDDDNYG